MQHLTRFHLSRLCNASFPATFPVEYDHTVYLSQLRLWKEMSPFSPHQLLILFKKCLFYTRPCWAWWGLNNEQDHQPCSHEAYNPVGKTDINYLQMLM
ncbi:PREDICTED: uncharacterized protein C5orf56-like [Galeopterus variegatus]|uniref:Uncharacterized protein C5orf56-like n=1 Tax=Galeopterus variegatus TaxID=482537 RepID=A0ABM0QND8_GALVR|nr:PREDICTED: uncharacterized protein C5orf56-like [Galeopterus variegatus]